MPKLPRRNADLVERSICLQALTQAWSATEFRRQLCRALADLDPYPYPPEPTDQAPGGREKIALLQSRYRRFKLHHPDDRQHDACETTGNRCTQNRNGRGTELEEVPIQHAAQREYDGWDEDDDDDEHVQAKRAWEELEQWHAEYAAKVRARRRNHEGTSAAA